MPPPDLVDVPEIARMLSAGRRTVFRWVDRDDFPAPYATISGKRLWRRPAVETWAKRTLPLPRGPQPKQRD